MKPEQLFEDAKRKLAIADHFMFVTYPLLKETKMLKMIMDNVADSVFKSMQAVLEKERMMKKATHLTGNFHVDFELFRSHSSQYGFTPKHHYLVQELRAFHESKMKSHMEFVRGDKYVFAFEDFSMKVLTADKVKSMIENANDFLAKAEGVLKC